MVRRSALAALGSAVPAYYLSSESSRVKTLQTLDASRRIANLVGTAGLMICDYSHSLYWSPQRKQLSEYATLSEALKQYQHDQEVYTLEQWRAGKDKVLTAQWQAKIVDTRRKIDETAEALGRLSSSTPPSSSSSQSSSSAASANPLSACHKRSATRLRDMCAANRGCYIKLGQHLAMLDHILPREYNDTLSSLLADTPRTTYAAVRRVVKEDLGGYPEELFATFDPVPIASASLAQVHVATLHDGRKVAVKVQHEGLREGSTGDMLVITLLVDLVSRVFEGFSYTWLSREMNANLPQELDFENEANNLEKSARLLRGFVASGDLVIPAAHRALSSKRILTMDFESGCYVTDVEEIDRMGLKTADVARLISLVFCEQIYRWGFCHCDPHEGNVLVRPQPGGRSGRPQIVLLDHGLYRQLGDTFRRDYCRLWRALVLGDEKEIKLRCENLHVGKAYTLLAAVLTMRPWDDIVSAGDDLGRLKSKNTSGENEMLRAYAKRYFKDIVGMLGQVDSEMLLLLKTNDCLRHLDKRLGAPINTAVVVAEITSDVVFHEELGEVALLRPVTYLAVLGALQRWARMRVRLFFLRAFSWYLEWRGSGLPVSV